MSLHHILSSDVVAPFPSIHPLTCCSPTPGYQSSHDFQCPRPHARTHASCHDFMYNKQRRCTTTSTITPLPNYSSSISAVQSLRISNSDRSAVFSITRPFSLAKCSRQMKQYDVEISSITGLGYTDCRLFMTEVNLSGSSWFASVGVSAGFYIQALV